LTPPRYIPQVQIVCNVRCGSLSSADRHVKFEGGGQNFHDSLPLPPHPPGELLHGGLVSLKAVSRHYIHSLFICCERTIAHSKHCPAYQQRFPTVECTGSAVLSCLEFHGMGIRCGKQALVKKTHPQGHPPSDLQRHSDESDRILR
jgi:hypothetical protein